MLDWASAVNMKKCVAGQEGIWIGTSQGQRRHEYGDVNVQRGDKQDILRGRSKGW